MAKVDAGSDVATTSSGTARGECRWCGKLHGARCPSVKAVEYASDGVTVTRVEFVGDVDAGAVLVGADLLEKLSSIEAGHIWGIQQRSRAGSQKRAKTGRQT